MRALITAWAVLDVVIGIALLYVAIAGWFGKIEVDQTAGCIAMGLAGILLLKDGLRRGVDL